MNYYRKFFTEDGSTFNTLEEAMIRESHLLQFLTVKELKDYSENKIEDYKPSISYGLFNDKHEIVGDCDNTIWELNKNTYEYILQEHYVGQGYSDLDVFKDINTSHSSFNFHPSDTLVKLDPNEKSNLNYVEQFTVLKNGEYVSPVNKKVINTNFEERFGDKNALVFCIIVSPCKPIFEELVNNLDKEYDKIEKREFNIKSEEFEM